MVYSSMGLAKEKKIPLESLQRSKQQLFEANEKLRQVTRAKYECMAKMSHELRTPLNVIIGFSELMLDEVPGKINEEQRQDLNDILSNGRRLLKLIDDILDQFEAESGENH